MRRAAMAIVALGLGLGCGGEDRGAKTSWPEPAKDALVKTTESGPVKATVQVWPAQPTLGDPIYLRLTVESDPGVLVDVPVDTEGFGRFDVERWDPSNRHRADGG